MAIDSSRAFEAFGGVIIDEAAGLFSGSGSPEGNAAPLGSRYYQKDTGTLWRKNGAGVNDWIKEHEPGRDAGIDHNNMFFSDFGRTVKSSTYTNIYRGLMAGDLVYPPSSTYEFVTFARVKKSNDPCEIRLYDATNLNTLTTQTIDYETEQSQTTTFTLATGDVIAEIDVRQAAGKGDCTVFNAGVVVTWEEQ